MPDIEISAGGSLSLLSAGWRGLEAWRDARGTDWQDARRREAAALGAAAEPVAADVQEIASDLDIVVVTGLPRSGTSMLMQMLRAGGIEPFTDAAREADASNPRGYFEHDRVKALPHDVGWLPDADGKSVKVVAPLAASLPQGPRLRVLLIERDLDEVIGSQSTMLARSGQPTGQEHVLHEVYAQQLMRTRGWMRDTPNVTGLRIQHRDVLDHPTAEAERIAAFLADSTGLDGRSFDVAAAAAVVDASLHREQRG